MRIFESYPCVYSAALCLPHILCNSACLSCKNGFCVYSAALRLPHILCNSACLSCDTASAYIWPDGHIYCSRLGRANGIVLSNSIWRYMRALRHSLLLEACMAANMFALLASAYIWPDGHIYCSRLGRANGIALSNSIWRYMRALRHSQLLEACTAANMFALLASAYICRLRATYTVHASAEQQPDSV